MFTSLPLRDLTVSSTMAKQLVTCKPGDTVAAVEKIMSDAQVRRLPVVEADGALVGIVALADIAREAARERHIGARDVLDAEVRETLYGICKANGTRLAA